MDTATDKELIEQYRNSHESEYIGALFIKYSHLVTGLCLKYFKDEDKAKDAVMDIFEQNLIYLKRHSVDNYKSWLYSVTKNYCLQVFRKEKSLETRKQQYFKETKEEIVESESIMHQIGRKEYREAQLKDALDKLKSHQKECLELFYFQGKSYEEITELTQYELKKVKSYIQNGKRNLKNYLEQSE